MSYLDRFSSSVGLGVTATAAVVVASSAAWLLRPPPALPNRIARIEDAEVQIDNDGIYASFDWWNEHHPLQAANAARIPYFIGTIASVVGTHRDLAHLHVLDIGCGGGLVTEQIALNTSARVTGIDTSQGSIDDAKQHLRKTTREASDQEDTDLEARLEYIVGTAYKLPFASSSFDAIICSDVFEHLLDLKTAMSEMERVLKPGGVLVYDTINRSIFAWYTTIVLFQKMLRFVPDHAHDWRLYITPSEMQTLTHDAGLRHAPLSEIRGMVPTPTMPWTLAYRWWRKRSISLWAMMGPFILTAFTQASYLSYAVKPAE